MKSWLIYALTTTLFWGMWGAFMEVPEKNGFPGTLSYVVWALTMLIPAVVALIPEKFAIDHHRKAIIHGMVIGLTGAGGTVALFEALSIGPAYLIFPIIALSPVITVCMAAALIGERTGTLGWTTGKYLPSQDKPVCSNPQMAIHSHGSVTKLVRSSLRQRPLS